MADTAVSSIPKPTKAPGSAGPWTLTWRRFKAHKAALVSGFIVLGIYFVALFAEIIAPVSTETYSASYTYAPPQMVKFFGKTPDGETHFLYVNDYSVKTDPISLSRSFAIDEKKVIPVGFFVDGEAYNLWGLIPMSTHLIGPKQKGKAFYLFGADRLGRDVFSRTIHGARVSMSIGLVGVTTSLVLGIFFGGISGYYGGWIDDVIQRVIEFLKSIPTVPLWMGLAAAIPPNIDPLMVYFWITIILSLLGWTDIARVVRGRFLSLRTEDFVIAARLDGCRQQRIIWRHMVPSFMSHIIASVTLSIPGMILAETALSFLGIGLRPPVVSWGVLLKEAQSILAVSSAPWLFLPGVAVVIAVLALNFLGDGVRDAVDPYSR